MSIHAEIQTDIGTESNTGIETKRDRDGQRWAEKQKNRKIKKQIDMSLGPLLKNATIRLKN